MLFPPPSGLFGHIPPLGQASSHRSTTMTNRSVSSRFLGALVQVQFHESSMLVSIRALLWRCQIASCPCIACLDCPEQSQVRCRLVRLTFRMQLSISCRTTLLLHIASYP